MSGALAARPAPSRARRRARRCRRRCSALPMPAVVLDAENRFRYANPAAELFFQLSFPTLATMSPRRPAAGG